MASTVEERTELSSLPDVERADALRGMNLVAGNRERVAGDSVDVDRDLGSGLHRIGVETYAGFGGDPSDFFDGLQGSGCVVRHHDGDQLRVGTEGATHIGGIDETAAVDGHDGDFTANFFEVLSGMQNHGMVDAGGDHGLARRG